MFILVENTEYMVSHDVAQFDSIIKTVFLER